MNELDAENILREKVRKFRGSNRKRNSNSYVDRYANLKLSNKPTYNSSTNTNKNNKLNLEEAAGIKPKLNNNKKLIVSDDDANPADFDTDNFSNKKEDLGLFEFDVSKLKDNTLTDNSLLKKYAKFREEHPFLDLGLTVGLMFIPGVGFALSGLKSGLDAYTDIRTKGKLDVLNLAGAAAAPISAAGRIAKLTNVLSKSLQSSGKLSKIASTVDKSEKQLEALNKAADWYKWAPKATQSVKAVGDSSKLVSSLKSIITMPINKGKRYWDALARINTENPSFWSKVSAYSQLPLKAGANLTAKFGDFKNLRVLKDNLIKAKKSYLDASAKYNAALASNQGVDEAAAALQKAGSELTRQYLLGLEGKIFSTIGIGFLTDLIFG